MATRFFKQCLVALLTWDPTVVAEMEVPMNMESVSLNSLCSSTRIPKPEIFGLKILDVITTYKQNYTFPESFIPGSPIKEYTFANTNFCNVTVTYTHPGWEDEVNVIMYLPSENWNGRFQATGGGGFATGAESFAPMIMIPSMVEGFAVALTDGGHAGTMESALDPNSWALSSPGNVNLHLLQDFASVALHDMALIGKAVIKSYYGSPPVHSYFYGGSTGGRQGLMLAQKYPKDFDGIIAICPAINWAHFLMADFWPAFMMNKLGEFPRGCEMQAMTQAAIVACDELDGVLDGIISLPYLCKFDPQNMIGKSFDCDGTPSKFSAAAASVAEAAWFGPRSFTNSKFQWYGIGLDSDLGVKNIGIASSACSTGDDCKAVPFPISDNWIKYFVVKDPDFDTSKMSHDQWDAIFHASINEYQSIIGTADPDLSEFRKAGGKIFTWHGFQDPVIAYNGTVDYYNKVLKEDPHAQDFYRLFLAPGAGHGFYDGPTPKKLNDVIMAWVEQGIAPETLRAVGPDGNGKLVERDLCMYPRIQVYRGGDPTIASSFECVEP